MAQTRTHRLMKGIAVCSLKSAGKFAVLLLFVAYTSAQGTSNVHVDIDDAQFSRIRAAFQAKLDQEVAKAKIPGATIAFVLPNGQRASFASGVRSLESRAPMQPDDPMFAGSIGKTFVVAV